MRSSEKGWRSAAMHDPAERRGIWFRVNEGTKERPYLIVEVCGGREGDDDYVKFEVGKTLSQNDLNTIEDILDRSRWVLEDYEIDVVRNRANVRFNDGDEDESAE